MNRKAFLLAGLLTDFRRTLAAGQWLAPYICSCCFLSRRFFFVGGFCPTDFTDLHRFFHHDFSSSDFTDDRRHSCLSDYSRIFAEFWPLANGLRPIYAPVVFCHADFADDADFSSWKDFVPQISQIYTDFLWNLC